MAAELAIERAGDKQALLLTRRGKEPRAQRRQTIPRGGRGSPAPCGRSEGRRRAPRGAGI